MTFGSLFAGIGGLDLGLERAGLSCSWQVEIDPFSRRVLEKHWPLVRRHDDVHTFPRGDPKDWRVDLIAGGFPCQDVSNAGPKIGLEGRRSGLWEQYHRVVRILRPRFVLVENVAALLVRGIDRVLGDLASLGFDAEWACIPAAAVGAAHIRERVFILAYADCGGRQQGKGPTGAILWGQKPRNVGARLSGCDEWDPEPDVGRMAYGIPSRMDRVERLGNAVVPQVAEWLGGRILRRVNDNFHNGKLP